MLDEATSALDAESESIVQEAGTALRDRSLGGTEELPRRGRSPGSDFKSFGWGPCSSHCSLQEAKCYS